MPDMQNAKILPPLQTVKFEKYILVAEKPPNPKNSFQQEFSTKKYALIINMKKRTPNLRRTKEHKQSRNQNEETEEGRVSLNLKMQPSPSDF